MTIRLLGTAAAEGIPAFYSGSRVSEYARKHGGREVRTRCGALVDGSIKIDLPPDTLAQLHRDGLDARDWALLVFTHSHDDHFAIKELQYGLFPFNDLEKMDFPILGNEEICRRIAEEYPEWPMEVNQSRSFETFTHMQYSITPISANHTDSEQAHNLLIEREGKCLLYATDTGVWKEDTWEYLRSRHVGLLVMECTEGFRGTDYSGHLDIIEFLHVRDRLAAQGTIDQSCKIVTTHHSHNGDATYAELAEAFDKEGVTAGYDGLEISF